MHFNNYQLKQSFEYQLFIKDGILLRDAKLQAFSFRH